MLSPEQGVNIANQTNSMQEQKEGKKQLQETSGWLAEPLHGERLVVSKRRKNIEAAKLGVRKKKHVMEGNKSNV